jgi:hypothetical protein
MTVEEKIGILVERYCRNRSHLADMIKVSPQTVNNWVYRDHIPRKGIEAIMARFPQLDIEWLRGDSAPLPSGSLPLPDEDSEEDDTLQFGTKSFARPDAQGRIADIPMPGNQPTVFVSGLQPSLGDVPQPDVREALVPLQMLSDSAQKRTTASSPVTEASSLRTRSTASYFSLSISREIAPSMS